MEPATLTNGNPRRKVLQMAVSTVLMESGFDAVEKDALETLTEMLQTLLVEIGHSSRSYYELSGRTEPVIGDVVVSLINMGMKLEGIDTYGKRDSRHVIPTPQQATATKPLSILQAGTKQPHPSHIPGHLPDLPDPHAYIRTPTYKQPVTEYEAIREKAANQKRDIEKALTKFLAKTSETHSLFEAEDNIFPLIAPKPAYPAYMAALNPTDQVFDFEELEYYYQVANRKEDMTETNEDMEGEGSDGENDNNSKEDLDKSIKDEEPQKDSQQSNGGSATPENPIDNPYLRAASMPHKTKHEVGTI